MIDLIKQINEENASGFIARYGKISDKNIAMELLCITSNAWLVLDDNIKVDSEVIMYYQPMGKMHATIFEDIGGVLKRFIIQIFHKKVLN